MIKHQICGREDSVNEMTTSSDNHDKCLSIIQSEVKKIINAANKLNGVDQRSSLGILTGLDNGCFINADGICKTCFKELSKDKIPKAAAVNGNWQGLTPDVLQPESVLYPDGLNYIEQSMVSIYNPILVFKMLPNGMYCLCNNKIYLDNTKINPSHSYMNLYINTKHFCFKKTAGAFALTSPTFTVVNNIAVVAQSLPRMPDSEVIVQIMREGSTSKKKYYFRPSKVNAALRWLKLNNHLYCDVNINVISEISEQVFVNVAVNLSEKDDHTLVRILKENIEKTNSTIHSAVNENVLLYTEDPPSNRDELIMSLLAPLPKDTFDASDENVNSRNNRSKVLHLPRVPGRPLPHEDKYFYAKCFPCLFPYGKGGYETDKMTETELTELLVTRRNSAFGRCPGFYFTIYTYRMRKCAGGVAKTATDKFVSTNIEEFLQEIEECITAQDLIQILEQDDGAKLKRLLRAVEPYASSLPGSIPHITSERNQLFSMLASPALGPDARFNVFGTNSPCDLFTPEFFNIVCPGVHLDSISIPDRLKLLRDNPAIAVRCFDARVTAMFDNIYLGKAEPFGKIWDWWMRTEFQSKTTIIRNNTFNQLHLRMFISTTKTTTHSIILFFLLHVNKDRGSAHIHFLFSTSGVPLAKLKEQFYDYVMKTFSAWLPESNDATSEDAQDETDPFFNPERGAYDKCHPCSEPIDITLDYGFTGLVGQTKYNDERVKQIFRRILLAVQMHRCCATCHK